MLGCASRHEACKPVDSDLIMGVVAVVERAAARTNGMAMWHNHSEIFTVEMVFI